MLDLSSMGSSGFGANGGGMGFWHLARGWRMRGGRCCSTSCEDCNFIYVEMLVSLGEQMMDDCGSFELASFWEIFHWTRRKKREIELCDLVNLGMQAEFEIFFFLFNLSHGK